MSSSPTMNQILDPWMILPLRELGKVKWLRWAPFKGEDGLPRSEIQLIGGSWTVEKSMTGKMTEMWEFIRLLGKHDTSACFHFYALSKALAEGPKVLRPTVHQCTALEHVDVNVSFADYEQPFPVFFVELPERYRQETSKRFNEEFCPKFICVFHDKETGYIVTAGESGPTRPGTVCIMSARDQWRTIEDAMRFKTLDGQGLRQGELLYRMAVNFGLLLTHYGVKDKGPVDPASVAKHKHTLKKSPNEEKKQKAREMLNATMNLIEIEQDIQFHEESGGRHEPGDGTGPKKKSHWRRGHFRRQSHGKLNALRKIIFVKPVFVNPDYFKGDVANTEYHIHG